MDQVMIVLLHVYHQPQQAIRKLNVHSLGGFQIHRSNN